MHVRGSRIVSPAAVLLLAPSLSLTADQKPGTPSVSPPAAVGSKQGALLNPCPSGWHLMPVTLASTVICIPYKPSLTCGRGTTYVEHTGPSTRLYGYGGPYVDVPDCSIGCRRLRTSPPIKPNLSNPPPRRANPLCPAGWHLKPGTHETGEDGVEQFMCLPDKPATRPPCNSGTAAAECDCAFGCVVGIH